MKVLFVMFQGAGTNSKSVWETPSGFGKRLRELGDMYIYQHKLNNVFGYVEPWAEGYPKDLNFDLGYFNLDRHIRGVYNTIPEKYRDANKYIHIPVAWSAGGYLALAYANLIPMSKACVLLDPVMINPITLEKHAKFLESKGGTSDISNDKFSHMLNTLRESPTKDLAYTICAIGHHCMTSWVRENIPHTLPIPTLSFITIEKKETTKLGPMLNAERKREVKFLKKHNPTTFKVITLDNVGHCVFNKPQPTDVIVKAIADLCDMVRGS